MANVNNKAEESLDREATAGEEFLFWLVIVSSAIALLLSWGAVLYLVFAHNIAWLIIILVGSILGAVLICRAILDLFK
jgi:hypothetical protein